MKLPGQLTKIYERLYSAYGPQGWWPGNSPFETIVGAVLTQNTAWTNVDKALTNLRTAECMTPQAMRDITEEQLALLIRPSGYFNTKARKLKAVVEYLARYDDNFDHWLDREAKELRAELLSVYGIGPETADDIVLYVAHLPSFVVDTYTQRIVDRLGLTPARRTYDAYQALFEANLPTEAPLFNEYHALLDLHAKDVCTKRNPHCDGCCLLDICPTGKS